MKTIEKIAVIWVAPLFLLAIIAIGIVSTIIYLLKLIFVFSGTAGAATKMISAVRQRFNAAKWERLQRHDALMAELDRKIKNN